MLYGYETHQIEKLMKEKSPSVVGAKMVRKQTKDDV
jgi:hypothetical protein